LPQKAVQPLLQSIISSVPQTDSSIRSYQNIELFSASGIMAQLISVECDTETGPGGQVDVEISEA